MNDTTLAHLTFLNTLKHQVRDVTKALDRLDITPLGLGQSLEANALKHEVSILLPELKAHGLLPEDTHLASQDYQEQTVRTLRPDLTTPDRLTLCGLGLCGEAGEVADLLKKHLYHGKPLNVEKLTDEMGDVLWYLSVLCSTLEITIEDVMQANLKKLQARHPNGFHPNYASDSQASHLD